MAVRDDSDILVAPQAKKIPVKSAPPPRPAELPNKIEDGAGSEVVKIKERNDRYDVDETSWTLSAFNDGVGDNPQIQPLRGEFGKWPDMHPLLLIDGIVIKVGGLHLVSQKTLNDIEASDNPHYDIRRNGEVNGRTIGGTIPIIEIKTDGLMASGSLRDELNIRAGVKQVDYIYESDMVEGVPQGLIDHIHFMFGLPGAQRSEDRFEIYDFGFTKDFGVAGFKTLAIGPDGKVDRTKLNDLVKASKAKANGILSEFNIIKQTFYSGKIPEDKAKNLLEYRKRAEAFDPYHERQDKEYIVKTSVLQSVQTTPVDAVHNAVSAVATATVPAVTPKPEIGTTGGEENALIARWQSYGLTSAEKSHLKFSRVPAPAGGILSGLLASNPDVVALNGKRYNVGIRWEPAACDKVRVIGEPINLTGLSSLFNLSGTERVRTRLIEYYGINTPSEWIRLNAKRKAEVLELADKIVELERTTGLIY